MTVASTSTAAKPVLRVMLCSPRGFCAGVERAIEIVELALARYGAPVYVRHEIVHNRFVVESLKAKGAIFVEELDEIPETTAPVIFSAHGVPKSVPDEAKKRNFFRSTPPARWSPRCTARRRSTTSAAGEILLIGHAGHPEVVGTMGQLAARRHHAGRDRRRDRGLRAARSREPRLRHADHAVGRRHRRHRRGAQGQRFRRSTGRTRKTSATPPPTARRRSSEVAPRVDAMVVVGAPNSSNSQRLSEVAERAGCPRRRAGPARRRDRLGDVRRHRRLGITAGASAPEVLVEEVIDGFASASTSRSRRSRPPRRACSSRCRGCSGERGRGVASGEARESLESGQLSRPSDFSDRVELGGLYRCHDEELALPGRLRLGAVLSCKGIAEGVENSNFLLHTEPRPFHPDALREAGRGRRPAVLSRPDGASARARHHLPAAGARTATARRSARLAGRPAAIVTFLDGMWVRRPTAAHCAALGTALAQLHLRRRRFRAHSARMRCRSKAGGRSMRPAPRAPTRCSAGLARCLIATNSTYLEAHWPHAICRAASSTPTCSPTTCSSSASTLSGLIDFYFACNDMLAYDVAICLNAWCFEPDQSFNVTKARALLARLCRGAAA